jgi:hypothetical protein
MRLKNMEDYMLNKYFTYHVDNELIDKYDIQYTCLFELQN